MGYKCPKCGKVVKSYQNMVMHYKRNDHSGYDVPLEKDLDKVTEVSETKIEPSDKPTITMDEWDEDDIEEYMDNEGELAILRQEVKKARLRYKKWKYDNPERFHQLTQPVVNPAGQTNQMQIIDIIKLVKEMQSTGQQMNIGNLKEMIEFSREFAGEGSSGEDEMITQMLPLLLSRQGSGISVPQKELSTQPEPSLSPVTFKSGEPLESDYDVTTIEDSQKPVSEDERVSKEKKTKRTKK